MFSADNRKDPQRKTRTIYRRRMVSSSGRRDTEKGLFDALFDNLVCTSYEWPVRGRDILCYSFYLRIHSCRATT